MLILDENAEIMPKFGQNTSITMQKTSKWQTHLPYLHLENLRVHNSWSDNFKSANN